MLLQGSVGHAHNGIKRQIPSLRVTLLELINNNITSLLIIDITVLAFIRSLFPKAYLHLQLEKGFQTTICRKHTN